MERLKGSVETLLCTFWFYLHSSMERLKAEGTSAEEMAKDNLHSSMERLKVRLLVDQKVGYIVFTFQYGEIKSVKVAESSVRSNTIYIPVWRD